jgi:hypothetical protein
VVHGDQELMAFWRQPNQHSAQKRSLHEIERTQGLCVGQPRERLVPLLRPQRTEIRQRERQFRFFGDDLNGFAV